MDYTVIGDGVNLGARIEGQTKTYGVDIIIGENTMKAINSDFNFTTLQLDCIAVSPTITILSLNTDKSKSLV